jgi:hypothetical protein
LLIVSLGDFIFVEGRHVRGIGWDWEEGGEVRIGKC